MLERVNVLFLNREVKIFIQFIRFFFDFLLGGKRFRKMTLFWGGVIGHESLSKHDLDRHEVCCPLE